MNLKCANLYLGVDGELETMVQFCYDQMTSTVHFMKTMNSIPLAKVNVTVKDYASFTS